MFIVLEKESSNFCPSTNRRKDKLRRKFLSKQKRENRRTWKAGRIVTIKTTDVLKDEHIFICRMVYLPPDFRAHRCTTCKIINHFSICMYHKSKGCINCMQKSDLSCFPRLIKRVK